MQFNSNNSTVSGALAPELTNEALPGSEFMPLPWLLLPGLVGFICWHATSFLIVSYRDRLDAWLEKPNQFKGSHKRGIWVLVLEILVIGGCMEAADLSEIANGNLDVGSLVACTILPFAIAILVFTQNIKSYHQSQSQKRFQNNQLSVASREADKARLAAQLANEQRAFAERIQSFLTKLIESQNEKLISIRENITKKINDEGSPIRSIKPPEFLKIASPITLETSSLVAIAQQVFESHKPRIHGQRNHVRAALFERKGDKFEVVASFDGVKELVVRTPRAFPDRFKLTNLEHCLAVKVGYRHRPMVVSDAHKGNVDRDCPFCYFEPNQSDRIKSTFAIPICFDNDATEACRYVLCIDSDRPAFFDDEMKEELAFFEDFAKERLQLAYKLDDLYQRLFQSFTGPRR